MDSILPTKSATNQWRMGDCAWHHADLQKTDHLDIAFETLHDA